MRDVSSFSTASHLPPPSATTTTTTPHTSTMTTMTTTHSTPSHHMSTTTPRRAGAKVRPFSFFLFFGFADASGRDGEGFTLPADFRRERGGFNPPFLFSTTTGGLQHTRNMKRHPRWCLFVFGVVPSRYSTHRARKDTSLVSFCVQHCSFALTHAEQEKTPSLVYFRVRRCSFALQHTPNMKRHLRWCLFLFSVFPSSSTTHAEHKNAPLLVFFRVRHLFEYFYVYNIIF